MKKNILLLLLVGAMPVLSACSVTSVTDSFRDPEKLSAQLHAEPRFWNDTVSIDEKTGLYLLRNEYFTGQPYNDIMPFGDNIILIGQGTYVDEMDDLKERFEPDDDSGEDGDWDSAEYQYSFTVYNPWSNQITASLDHKDISYDTYQVIGDRLLLSHFDEKNIDVFDLSLKKVASIDLSQTKDTLSTTLYQGPREDTFLTFDYESDDIYLIDLSKQTAEVCSIDLYQPSIVSVSPDGSRLLVNGIDKESLKYVCVSYDTSDMTVADELPEQGGYTSGIDEDGFLVYTDYSLGAWVYNPAQSDENLLFSMENIVSVKLLPDDTFLLLQQSDSEDGEHVIYTCYQADPAGNILHSFSYDCGASLGADDTYLAPDFVYLKEADSVVFLAYTANVNPQLIIWNLSEAADAGTSLDPFPVEDPNAAFPDHDWGDLREANDYASEMEERYGVSIYIGGEIPESIDVYDTKQALSSADVMEALRELDRQMGFYPEDFFRQLPYASIKDLRIYLTGDITSEDSDVISTAAGFVNTIDDHNILVLDVSYSWDWSYIANHEISHLIDRRLIFKSSCDPASVYSDEKWADLNPSDTDYMNSYSDYEDSDLYDSYPDYFLDPYGTTYATEDRAQIFGQAMDDYETEMGSASVFADNEHLKAKLRYYCASIRDSFSTENWPDVLPWEYCCQ